ncbi:MAG TPA: Hsp20/alpha crystallin family protein [Smithellaceae bacterium]|nr:Hsp20/alpha crystallin family protein [Smithellaceae bacterium]
MTYIKINFGGHFEDEFHKAVDQVFHLVRPAFKNYECVWRPNIDVYESAEEIVVLADMAGLNKDELHIEVNRSKMKLAGIRKAIHYVQNVRYCQAEIPHGYFERVINLPAPVDAQSAAASYADGMLTVRMNKLPAGKTHRVSVITD